MQNTTSAFKLYQPSLLLADNYRQQIPQEEYRNAVALFYQFKLSAGYKFIAVPAGAVDIVFCCDPANPSARIIGSVLNGKQLVFTPDIEHFGIRFLPGRSGLFIEDTSHFAQQEVSLPEVMPKGSALAEKMASCVSFNERVKLFLQTPVSGNNALALPDWGQYILHRINERRGLIKVEDLAADTGYSTRYINKTFTRHLGLSPKQFCRIVRFQSSLELIYLQPDIPISYIVAELGYYDQAHFSKEFKDFSLTTPSQLQEKFKARIDRHQISVAGDYCSDFYNTATPRADTIALK